MELGSDWDDRSGGGGVEDMIHYHGTPITPRQQLTNMVGRNFCISYPRPDDLRVCLDIGQCLMFDNGAFSAYTRKIEPNWNQYYGWLDGFLAHPHFAIIPDVIDGTIEQQKGLVNSWPFSRSLGAPVWHMAEPISRLCDLIDEGWLRVCFGSSGEYWDVGSSSWCGRMDEAFNAIVKNYRDIPWIHGLRMLGQVNGDWPLASADSTNIAQNYKRDTGCANCKAAVIDAQQTPIIWNARDVQKRLI